MIKIAILDLYEGHANEGMRCIKQIIDQFKNDNNLPIVHDEFEVRLSNNVPDLSYDVYISSGGPGSPLESEDVEWEVNYFRFIERLQRWNAEPGTKKKHVLFICHSFQLVCRHFRIAQVAKRKSTAFGVFPVHLLPEGKNEKLFEGLPDPFYVVDSRDYQVIQPDMEQLQKQGAKILCIEKERPHVPLERAIMSVRFNDYMVGVQFHPEADAKGMLVHLENPVKKQNIIERHSFEKWQAIVEGLNNPEKILWTYEKMLPNFLKQAIGNLPLK
jgi:GMP synthase-like glutamine amidotransferase